MLFKIKRYIEKIYRCDRRPLKIEELSAKRTGPKKQTKNNLENEKSHASRQYFPRRKIAVITFSE